MAHGGFAPEISHQTRPSGMPLLPGGRALTLERRTAWLPGVLSGRFVGDAQTITTFSIESFFRFFHATPPARRRGSLHVNFRVILLSYRRLITRRLGNLVTLPCYCLLVITATPLRRLRYAVTRAPLSRSLRDGSGRLGTGPGRTRQSKPLYIHARTNWLVRQWALLHGPARAGPRWVSGGQELDRGKAIAHRSVLKRRLR